MVGPKFNKKRPASTPDLSEMSPGFEDGTPKHKIVPRGPSLAPHLMQQTHSFTEDFIGAILPDKSPSPSVLNNTLSIIEQRSQYGLKNINVTPKREEWMVNLPISQIKIDPLNLKSRQFNQSSKVLRGEEKETEAVISKTEEQRQKKLEKFVSNYNKEHRGKSLMDQYTTKRGVSSQYRTRGVRQPFDPQRDLDVGRKNESRILSTLNNSEGDSNRFRKSSNGKYM